jgi:hypothetical protein
LADGQTVTDWCRLNTEHKKPPAAFAEWMMGFPAQWTDLEPLATPSFRR